MKYSLTLPNRVLKAAAISWRWALLRDVSRVRMLSSSVPAITFQPLHPGSHMPTLSTTFVSSSPVTLIPCLIKYTLLNNLLNYKIYNINMLFFQQYVLPLHIVKEMQTFSWLFKNWVHPAFLATNSYSINSSSQGMMCWVFQGVEKGEKI